MFGRCRTLCEPFCGPLRAQMAQNGAKAMRSQGRNWSKRAQNSLNAPLSPQRLGLHFKGAILDNFRPKFGPLVTWECQMGSVWPQACAGHSETQKPPKLGFRLSSPRYSQFLGCRAQSGLLGAVPHSDSPGHCEAIICHPQLLALSPLPLCPSPVNLDASCRTRGGGGGGRWGHRLQRGRPDAGICRGAIVRKHGRAGRRYADPVTGALRRRITFAPKGAR